MTLDWDFLFRTTLNARIHWQLLNCHQRRDRREISGQE